MLNNLPHQYHIKLIEGLMKEYILYLRGENKDFFTDQDHPHIIIAKKGLDIFNESVCSFVREQFKGVARAQEATLERMGSNDVDQQVERKEEKREEVRRLGDEQKIQDEKEQLEFKREKLEEKMSEKVEDQVREQIKKQDDSEVEEYYSCRGDQSPNKSSSFVVQQIQQQHQSEYPALDISSIEFNSTQIEVVGTTKPQSSIEPNPISLNQQVINHQFKPQPISTIHSSFSPIPPLPKPQPLELTLPFANEKQHHQNKIFTSICSNVASYSMKSRENNEDGLTKIIGLINYTHGLFRRTTDGGEENQDLEKVKIGTRIINILSEEKIKNIRELSKTFGAKNLLRAECEQLVQRIEVLY